MVDLETIIKDYIPVEPDDRFVINSEHCDCGNPFTFMKKRMPNGGWCFKGICYACGHKTNNLGQMNKRVNGCLNNWAKRVKHRDNYVCKICGSSENIEAHHLIPVKTLQNHDLVRLISDDNNGITLCKSCHDLIHEWR